MNTIWWKNTIK